MKFLLMVMTDEAAARAMSADERDRRVAEHGAFGRELRVAGKWVSSARLRFAPEATTIRRDGVVTDGPFAETKEVLGGFYLIEAESTAEAVAWAKKLPLGDAGAVEVRPAATGATWRGPLAGAKKFTLMIVMSEERIASSSVDDVFASIDHHYELSLELAEQRKFVSSRGLGPAASSLTIRSQNGERVVTDGPFAETKEVVAGYFVVSCDNMAEAIAWGKRLLFTHDAIEVRPVWEA